MPKIFSLRGTHLLNFKSYLFGQNLNKSQGDFFAEMCSDYDNLVQVIDSPDRICGSCMYQDVDYCGNGMHKISKRDISSLDRRIAYILSLKVGEIHTITNLAHFISQIKIPLYISY